MGVLQPDLVSRIYYFTTDRLLVFVCPFRSFIPPLICQCPAICQAPRSRTLLLSSEEWDNT